MACSSPSACCTDATSMRLPGLSVRGASCLTGSVHAASPAVSESLRGKEPYRDQGLTHPLHLLRVKANLRAAHHVVGHDATQHQSRLEGAKSRRAATHPA